ncbi:hypothetical protein OGAPHI_006818 [Ogataea philodendri]|uniref:AB hydrolase-1 domain-containing protein n=1 Tax=Ogataea philodendri TaxID=1378263 RepID=A0A9P8T0G1_9ASCO|nr:uncharacterized protein OGAPHI_006818 [Ogataea philodendri]KAH3661411.1 hypothetical protein OGAPHI_006818 [Ogataea philodendri]
MNTSTIRVTRPETSVRLRLNDSAPGSEIPFASLASSVPGLEHGHRFKLHPLLFHHFLQTMYLGKADYSKTYTVYYGREIIESQSRPGQFTLDYAVPPEDPVEFARNLAATQPENYPKLHPRTRYYTRDEIADVHKSWAANDLPIVLLMHGLGGGSHEVVVRSVVSRLHGVANVAVLNCRGCSRSKITTPTMFSALHTDDLAETVDMLHKLFPSKQIHLVGQSFGGLLIYNYLAQQGDRSVVTSAFTIGSSWNLIKDEDVLKGNLFGEYVYGPFIKQILARIYKSNAQGLIENPKFDLDEFNQLCKTCKHVSEIDDRFTAPITGFPSASTYYMAGSPILRIFKIRTPVVMLNDLSDPFISQSYPYAEVKRHPYLYMATSDKGSHLAYVDPSGDMWYSKVVRDYIASWKDVSTQRPLDDGFHVEQTDFTDVIKLY